jgi:dipeptidyl aminopeptidase/acylaminoacyl peptidase
VTLRAEDCLGLRSASDAQPSPAGERVAYVVNEADRAADQNRSSVWLAPIAGGGDARPFAEDGAQPRWAPDGTRLAFVREGQVWVAPVDGGEAVRLTDVSGGVTGPPVWSPDGQRIAYIARVAESERSGPRVIRRLRYMLNGAGYIGDGFWHIFAVTVDGPRTIQVTSGDWHHFAPAWSPDGTRLACVTTRRDDWDTEWVWDIYVLDASGSGGPERCLTDSGGTCAAPAWSPDGGWIAYYANECPWTAYAQDYYLWLVPAAGGAARNVSKALYDRGCQASQPPSVNEPPHWASDSKTVFCHIRDGGFFHYYAYELASDALRPVLAPSDVREPIDGWVRQSRDRSILAFAAATAVQPAEVYACAADGGQRRQITGLNGALEVSAPRRLTHTSPEGWEIESWLWLPPTHRSGDESLPCVLYYHGGPHNTVGLAFNETMHVLASAGFAVAAVNFRGSTGFGAAFADSILGDWGTRELEDGLTLVDRLVADGIVDPKRLGVYGGSYGGFMTNLALSRTDRFAAGVSFATISGLDTFANQTDHWESVDWDSGGPAWQIPDYYRTHSPLSYVADIGVPLLILHGEQDYRCAVGEADQLFGALRKLKRTVELVRYPGGAHSFAHNGPPSFRLDALRRIVGWFERYLH